LKRAIIPWHRAHTLSNADTLLPPILLPENQSKIQLLTFILVRGKKKKRVKKTGFDKTIKLKKSKQKNKTKKRKKKKKKNPST
jgi:hypothetical protein